MTYGMLLGEGERLLQGAGIAEAGLDAWYLFSHCFSMDRGAYFLHRGETLSEGETEAKEGFLRLVDRRRKRIPLQQILGSQEFMGLSFFVNEHVLIPRQDTETLVETVLSSERRRQPTRLLDLCTGSGCIGLSLAVYLPGEWHTWDGIPREQSREEKSEAGRARMEIILSDVSEKALLVAEENIGRLGLERLCTITQSDLFEAFEEQQFDCIVSNPPYIAEGEIEKLSPEVRDHEPGMALNGGKDGLTFYRAISEEAMKYLVPGGRLYLEIGWDQGRSVPRLLQTAGFVSIEVVKDLTGNDRVVKAARPE